MDKEEARVLHIDERPWKNTVHITGTEHKLKLGRSLSQGCGGASFCNGGVALAGTTTFDRQAYDSDGVAIDGEYTTYSCQDAFDAAATDQNSCDDMRDHAAGYCCQSGGTCSICPAGKVEASYQKASGIGESTNVCGDLFFKRISSSCQTYLDAYGTQLEANCCLDDSDDSSDGLCSIWAPPPQPSQCSDSTWGSYVLAVSGAHDCTGCTGYMSIDNYDGCEAAASAGAAALGIGGLGAASNWDGPPGCHVEEWTNFQWNENVHGGSAERHTPVCMRNPGVTGWAPTAADCTAWVAQHGCDATWSSACPGVDHPVDNGYAVYALGGWCTPDCPCSIFADHEVTAADCTAWAAASEDGLDATWSSACPGVDHPADAGYNDYALSYFCDEDTSGTSEIAVTFEASGSGAHR